MSSHKDNRAKFHISMTAQQDEKIERQKIERVMDEEALQKEMMQPDQPMKWRKKAIQTYQREMEPFEEELLILLHQQA